MVVFPYNFIYLSIYFVFGCAGSSWLAGFSLVVDSRVYSCCGVQTSHCGGFSCSGAWVLGCAGFSCGTWASLLRGMWDLPGPGIKQCLLRRQMDSLPLSHQGSSVTVFLTALILVKEFTSEQKHVWQYAPACGNHWSYPIPRHSETCSLIGWRISEPATSIWYGFTQSRLMGLGIKERKGEWHQSLLTLRTLTEYLFLVSVFFCLSGLIF